MTYMLKSNDLVLTSPLLFNFALLPEEAMKRKLEGIYLEASTSPIKYDEEFHFSMIPKTKIFSISSRENYLAYLTLQDTLYLCVCDFTDFNQKRIIYKEIEDYDKTGAQPTHIVISPDIKYVAYALDTNIELYSINLQDSIFFKLATFKGHTSRISVLAFDHSSTKIASGSSDCTIRIWDTTEGLFKIYRGHQSPICAIEFTGKESYVVSTGEDCMIVFWNYLNMEESLVMHSQYGVPNFMAFDLDIGVMITSSLQHYMLQLWDINAQKGHTAKCNGVKIARKRKLGLTFSVDGTLRIWSLRNGNCLSVFGIYPSIILASFSSQEDKIFYIDEDLKIREQIVFVNYQTNGSEYERYAKPTEVVTNYKHEKEGLEKFRKNFESLFSSFSRVKGWDNPSPSITQFFKFAEEVKMKSDLYFGNEMRKFYLKLNDVRMSLGPLDKVNYFLEDFIIPRSTYDRSPIVVGILSKTRNSFAYGDVEGKIIVYNLVTREVKKEFKSPFLKVAFLGFSSDDTLLMESNGIDNSFRIWDIEKGVVGFEMVSHESSIGCAELTPNNEFLLTGGNDSQLVVCNIQSSEITSKRYYIKKHHVFTSLCALDRKIIVSSSTDHMIRIWDIQAKSRIKVLSGHSDVVVQVYADPLAKHILSGSLDNTLRLWSLDTFVCEKIIKLPFKYLKKMDIIDLSKYALLAFENSTICVLNLATEEVKWMIQLNEEVTAAYWFRYPSKIIIQTALYIKVFALLWKLD